MLHPFVSSMSDYSGPLVSVVMSSYGHAAYIGHAIQSVLNQTYTHWELIICDDASKDATAEVVAPFLRDPRIRFFSYEENRRFHMKNEAILKATGKYIAILNSDDAFFPTKLEEQIKAIEAKPQLGAVFTPAKAIDNQGNEIGDRHTLFPYVEERSNDQWIYQVFFGHIALCHSSAFIKREVFDVIGLYNRWLTLISDVDFWARMCLAGYRIAVLPEALTYNRFLNNELNLSGQTKATHHRFASEYPELLKHFENPTAQKQIAEWFWDQPIALPSVEVGYYSFLKRALESTIPMVRQWALLQIRMVMSTTSIKDSLEQHLGTSIYADYYRLEAKTETFPVTKPLAHCFWKNIDTDLIVEEHFIYYNLNEKHIKLFPAPQGYANLAFCIQPAAMAAAMVWHELQLEPKGESVLEKMEAHPAVLLGEFQGALLTITLEAKTWYQFNFYGLGDHAQLRLSYSLFDELWKFLPYVPGSDMVSQKRYAENRAKSVRNSLVKRLWLRIQRLI
jgi:glycosyltransferase involved in cell wall biosynthesis